LTLQKPVIPATVTDQVRLWELERDRFRFADGVLYSQFLSQKDFEVLRDHARVCIVELVLHSNWPLFSLSLYACVICSSLSQTELCTDLCWQGDHLCGKPGNLREFDSCRGNV